MLIIVAAFAIATLIAALVLALTGQSTMTAALTGVLTAAASITAALTALFLSTAALTRSDRQLVAGVRALHASRLPFVAPLHEWHRLAGSGSLIEYPPTERRLPSPSSLAGIELFLADTRTRYLVPVENVGVGPALGLEGELWCSDGTVGSLSESGFLAVGHRITLSTELLMTSAVTPPGFKMTDDLNDRTHYWIELRYRDVFGTQHVNKAVFDPQGIGAWRQLPNTEDGKPSDFSVALE